MAQEPYRSARRVFWILDNGSGHRGPKAVERLQRQWPNLIPVFTPVHASWLNQVEIYFSVVQRKVLTPGDFADLAALEAALLGLPTPIRNRRAALRVDVYAPRFDRAAGPTRPRRAAAGRVMENTSLPSLQVFILIGSPNDAPVMQGAVDVLKELGISVEMTVASAHRSPDRVMRLLGDAQTRGVSVFIVGAGAAAHLGGVVAAHVTKPVIGVPIDSSALNGLDALLSTVQMPPGVPVATVSIGKPGATNAGVLAAQILALGDKQIAERVWKGTSAGLAEKVEEAARSYQSLIPNPKSLP